MLATFRGCILEVRFSGGAHRRRTADGNEILFTSARKEHITTAYHHSITEYEV